MNCKCFVGYCIVCGDLVATCEGVYVTYGDIYFHYGECLDELKTMRDDILGTWEQAGLGYKLEEFFEFIGLMP